MLRHRKARLVIRERRLLAAFKSDVEAVRGESI
jgi:hypothetical protein